MMVLGPFLNVIMIVLVVYSFVKMIYALIESEFGNGELEEEEETEEAEEGDNFSAERITQMILAGMFPLLLNFGFCTTAGVFLLQPVAERTSKMKQMLIMSGMSNFLYWMGLFLADLILLLFPFFLFFAFVLITQIDGFYDELWWLMAIIFSFGSSLIPLVYLISTAFKD